MEQLCGAFQMSLRKGMPVMLILAGLPYAKEKISSYEGCTFMQRAQEFRLESLRVSETHDAFVSLLHQAKGVATTEGTVDALAHASLGHPYLMQLLGYHLIEHEAERQQSGEITLRPSSVDTVFPIAYDAYRDNVLKPTLSRLGKSLTSYLSAACKLLDDERRAQTTEIARILGLSKQQASTYRQRLIQRRLIVPSGWGYVSLGLPYLDRYLSETEVISEQKPDVWRY